MSEQNQPQPPDPFRSDDAAVRSAALKQIRAYAAGALAAAREEHRQREEHLARQFGDGSFDAPGLTTVHPELAAVREAHRLREERLSRQLGEEVEEAQARATAHEERIHTALLRTIRELVYASARAFVERPSLDTAESLARGWFACHFGAVRMLGAQPHTEHLTFAFAEALSTPWPGADARADRSPSDVAALLSTAILSQPTDMTDVHRVALELAEETAKARTQLERIERGLADEEFPP